MCTIDDLLEWFDEEATLLSACSPISCDPERLQKQLAEQKVHILIYLLIIKLILETNLCWLLAGLST